MSGYVMVCSEPWVQPGAPLYFGQSQFECFGTLTGVPIKELNPSGLSAEDLSEYIGHVMILFAIVFGFLAIKKAIF